MGVSDKEIRVKTATIFRAVRKMRCLKQSEMAKELGVVQGTISKLESATLIPDAGLWYKFCTAMGISADLTYRSGYVFTNHSGEKVKNIKFLSGKMAKSRNLIRVKECLPFVKAIKNLGKQEEFSQYMKENKIDSDIFVIPNCFIPLKALSFTFDFLDEQLKLNNYKSEARSLFIEDFEYIANNATNLNKLIQNLEQIGDVFKYKLSEGKLHLTISDTLEFAKTDELFLSSYLEYRASLLKELCEKKLNNKDVVVTKNSSLEYCIEINA